MRSRSWLPVVLLALYGAAPVWPAAAGPAHLVADLNPDTIPIAGDDRLASSFQNFTRLGDRALFTSFLLSGDEVQCPLWVTDGTAAGTERVADLCPGSLDAPELSIGFLAVAGPVAFLAGPGGELWRSDGTAAGTFPLGAAVFGDALLGPGGILYFAVCTAAGECEPWRSDGTLAGTRMLRSVQARGAAIRFVVDGDHVVFSATGKRGAALWRTDGTRQGTRELVRLPSPVLHLLAVDGALYVASGSDVWLVPAGGTAVRRLGHFPIQDDIHPRGLDLFAAGSRLLIEVYVYDGIADLWEITARHHRPRFLARFEGGTGPAAEVGGRLVFAARAESAAPFFSLWLLAPGMSRPQPLSGCPGGCPAFDSSTVAFGAQGNRLLFAGRDAQHGSELWETDGTGPGTRLVRDLCPGVCDGFHSGFTPALGRLFFTAGERDLWVTDGTAAGTLPLGRTLDASPYGYGPDLAAVKDRVIFTGFDGAEVVQPWVSDLTAAGTAPLFPPGSGLAAGMALWSPAPSGPGVLFGTCDPGGMGVWRSDGTAAGTVPLLASGETCGSLGPFVRASGLDFFGFAGAGLWRSDGTPGGTLLVGSQSLPGLLGYAAVDGGLRFILDREDPRDGPPWTWSFWHSDGTPQGTVETGAAPLASTPTLLGAGGSDLFFVAQRNDFLFPYAVWRSDGTAAGTRALVDLAPGFWPSELVRVGGRTFLVLAGAERQTGPELWSTDGTAAGTVPVIADVEAPRPVSPRSLAAFHGALYFYAETGHPARPGALWRSDGTAAGTRIVAAFPPPRNPRLRVSPELTPAGDFLFFVLDDGSHGEELWRTDGTAEGTSLVRDLAPGPVHSHPGHLTAAGGRLYFAATDGEHGRELWVSDGTAAGTRVVQDVLPGFASSSPRFLVAADGNLFFAADDGEHGRELWVLPLVP